jgi:cation-transporting ATPase 13A1
LDEYWYYAIFTFFALLMFESTVAYNRLKGLQRLRSHTLHSHQKTVWVFRPSYPPGKNGWSKISASEIIPGDIISCKEATTTKLGREIDHRQKQHLNRVPADILILSGDAVVDESLLTGESVPQLKTALEDSSDSRLLDLQEHKQTICFGGTNLLVSHPGESINIGSEELPPAPDQGVIGMVLRTGFETAQGSLLRTMAHTQKSVDGIHTKDTYVFILLLLLCAVASAYMVWQEGSADESRNKFRLTLHVIMIITSVVPPELPMELSLAVTNSVADLMRRCQGM